MTVRKKRVLIYVRVVGSVDGRLAYVHSPITASAAIKSALRPAERRWDPDLRCWVIPARLVPALRLALDPARFHVRLADTEPRSSLPLFRNVNRRSPAA
jgi:hypothetical protein